jgi:predicted acylesterase/phospholipase RssA
LASALLPAGRRPTAHLRAPHEGMLGEQWPAANLWIVAVDLDVGPRVVFGRAGAPVVTVGQAVEASCAVPGYFAPVSIDGTRYVDGGMHSTTNADLAASLEPPPDLAVMAGNTMDQSKASAVCEQVVGSTRDHLRRKDIVERMRPFRG